MNNKIKRLLITGATGTQGGAVISEAIKHGYIIRALVRDKTSDSAKTLKNYGIEIVEGDFDDLNSLEKAMNNMDGVFAMTSPSPKSKEVNMESRQAKNLITIAEKQNIKKFVQTSVARTGDQESFKYWGEGYWSENYWIQKDIIERAVKGSNLKHWTILKPAYMMENWLPYRAKYFFPDLKNNILKSAFNHESTIDLVSAIDIAKFAVKAFKTENVFDKESIEIASESLTIDQIAMEINKHTDKEIEVLTISPDEAIREGISPGIVKSQEWNNLEGYQVDINKTKNYGIKLLSFSEWLNIYKSKLG
ncbi:NmrA/HSCARG family protein [Staphylococcus schweitzeri]|uniref:NmrA family NAD(P)-binding protein n=1 Tax=Staphylococcus schweitzeri TaxID=1654388 RepID=A0A2K4AJK1_9STAP|nr:NmrA family NAD(P)-binding protein [Staphylococcus schweitzeri]MBE2129667.1 NmrA family NAD(P)-binding protein [Staphylococcus schweitzeri]PNZ50271.1 NmrA/HSCARG family protein [Staphylococcus schweitzeri]CDR51340.1 NAD dependent epimerase/dehydratase family protein [Staphylococcus schweitzeri]CDR55034.1 NAD dependent epimerase/dehydratase family protein [Staphylococcus schweitzeri]CDR61979.1 NAD dependent epimerase/dehydratase family protein [Staphylococcus schweitzeri]